MENDSFISVSQAGMWQERSIFTWAEQCKLMCEHPYCFSAGFELVLFCHIWASGMFSPINDINYGVIALVACNNSPLFFFFF